MLAAGWRTSAITLTPANFVGKLGTIEPNLLPRPCQPLPRLCHPAVHVCLKSTHCPTAATRDPYIWTQLSDPRKY